VGFGHINEAVDTDDSRAGALHVGPFFNEFPRQGEELNSIILAVTHQQSVKGIDGDVVG
jgi:hypothetical protein